MGDIIESLARGGADRGRLVRHFAHVVANSSLSTAPRLFVMRERDEFMPMDQLERMGKRMKGEEGVNRGGVVDVKIVPGVSHFQLGKPRLRRARRADGFELAG